MISDTMPVGVPMFSDDRHERVPAEQQEDAHDRRPPRHCAGGRALAGPHEVQANSTAPANRNRAAAPSRVGTVSLTFSMPR